MKNAFVLITLSNKVNYFEILCLEWIKLDLIETKKTATKYR